MGRGWGSLRTVHVTLAQRNSKKLIYKQKCMNKMLGIHHLSLKTINIMWRSMRKGTVWGRWQYMTMHVMSKLLSTVVVVSQLYRHKHRAYTTVDYNITCYILQTKGPFSHSCWSHNICIVGIMRIIMFCEHTTCRVPVAGRMCWLHENWMDSAIGQAAVEPLQ